MSHTLDNCKTGNHNFKALISFGVGMDSAVVRWCQECGSVVVDTDYDGRINPGAVMPMRFPRVLQKGV